MSIADAPFSGKGLAPFLVKGDPDREEACRRVTSLFVNMRSAKRELDAAEHVLAPLLALLPHDHCAAGPLATMGPCLAGGAAYPEALACIDAVVDLTSTEPLGSPEIPWQEQGSEPMTWPRQQALLWLWRGECRLGCGDREGGEAALARGADLAKAAAMPSPFGLTGASSPFRGTVADFRLLALVHAGRSMRLRFEGQDPSPSRKVKRRKPGEKPDAAALSLARTYLDDALAAIAPRAAHDYAGLEPHPKREHPALTRAHRQASWQRFAYLESALIDEHLGDTTRARLHLGRAKWIAALFDPSHRDEPVLREAVTRLGAQNSPPA